MNNPTVYFPKDWRMFDALDWLAQRGVPATDQWVCPTIDFGQAVMFWTPSSHFMRLLAPFGEPQTPWRLERGVWDSRKQKEAGR